MDSSERLTLKFIVFSDTMTFSSEDAHMEWFLNDFLKIINRTDIVYKCDL